jgi:hypothetical protein
MLAFWGVYASADPIRLPVEDSRNWCSEVSDVTRAFGESVARNYNVSLSSIRFVRSSMGVSNYGTVGCRVFVDTSAGILDCSAYPTYRLDDGRVVVHVQSSFFGADCN